jgi:predicted nucleic acid-binding Zn ribbon protein
MKSGRSRKSNLVSISAVLRNSQKKTKAVFTISRLRKQWSAVVGEMMASQTRPKKIDRNILWVSVENSALNYELSLMKPAILEKIQEISQDRYKDIKFIHEMVDVQKTEDHGPDKQKFVRAKIEEGESLQSILEKIKLLSKDLQKKR